MSDKLFDTGENAAGFEADLKLAVHRALSALLADGTTWSRTELQTLDEAAQEVLARMPSRFGRVSPYKVRTVLQVIDKSNRSSSWAWPSSSPQDPARSTIAAVDRWIREESSAHSDQYVRVMASAAWWDFSSSVRRDCGYVCQMCGAVKNNGGLQVHHHTYPPDGSPDEAWCDTTLVIPVCESPCHKFADLARSLRDKEPSQWLPLLDS